MTSGYKLEILRATPRGTEREMTLLFVHGGYHAAWCWQDNFLPYFAARGYRGYALSLRGHGGSEGFDQIDSFCLRDFQEDVMSVLNALPEPRVVIGHSMGGMITQQILAERPGSIRAAVLLSAPPPSGIGLGAAFRWLRRGWRPMWQLSLLHRGKLQAEADIDAYPFSALRYGELTAEQRMQYAVKLQKESHRAGKEARRRFVTVPADLRVPVLVLGGAQDWFFPRKVLARTARAYHTEPIVVLGCGHMLMLDAGWRRAAECIEKFLTDL